MTVEDVKQNTKMQNGKTDELKRKKTKRAKKKTAAERKNKAKTCFLTELGGHCLLQVDFVDVNFWLTLAG
jgi:hypothetical protein